MTILEPILDTWFSCSMNWEHKTFDWVRDQVAYVLNYRYNENKVTIITTNFMDPGAEGAKPTVTDSLAQRIGDRIRSRLFEMCKDIKMDGMDFRAAVKQANHRI
jgi:DNA replication protein DnaC